MDNLLGDPDEARREMLDELGIGSDDSWNLDGGSGSDGSTGGDFSFGSDFNLDSEGDGDDDDGGGALPGGLDLDGSLNSSFRSVADEPDDRSARPSVSSPAPGQNNSATTTRDGSGGASDQELALVSAKLKQALAREEHLKNTVAEIERVLGTVRAERNDLQRELKSTKSALDSQDADANRQMSMIKKKHQDLIDQKDAEIKRLTVEVDLSKTLDQPRTGPRAKQENLPQNDLGGASVHAELQEARTQIASLIMHREKQKARVEELEEENEKLQRTLDARPASPSNPSLTGPPAAVQTPMKGGPPATPSSSKKKGIFRRRGSKGEASPGGVQTEAQEIKMLKKELDSLRKKARAAGIKNLGDIPDDPELHELRKQNELNSAKNVELQQQIDKLMLASGGDGGRSEQLEADLREAERQADAAMQELEETLAELEKTKARLAEFDPSGATSASLGGKNGGHGTKRSGEHGAHGGHGSKGDHRGHHRSDRRHHGGDADGGSKRPGHEKRRGHHGSDNHKKRSLRGGSLRGHHKRSETGPSSAELEKLREVVAALRREQQEIREQAAKNLANVPTVLSLISGTLLQAVEIREKTARQARDRAELFRTEKTALALKLDAALGSVRLVLAAPDDFCSTSRAMTYIADRGLADEEISSAAASLATKICDVSQAQNTASALLVQHPTATSDISSLIAGTSKVATQFLDAAFAQLKELGVKGKKISLGFSVETSAGEWRDMVTGQNAAVSEHQLIPLGRSKDLARVVKVVATQLTDDSERVRAMIVRLALDDNQANLCWIAADSLADRAGDLEEVLVKGEDDDLLLANPDGWTRILHDVRLRGRHGTIVCALDAHQDDLDSSEYEAVRRIATACNNA